MGGHSPAVLHVLVPVEVAVPWRLEVHILVVREGLVDRWLEVHTLSGGLECTSWKGRGWLTGRESERTVGQWVLRGRYM